MSINNRKLVYGVGVNDADYLVQIKEEIGYTEEGKRLRKTVFLCPFYVRWWHMLCRCYSEKYKSKHKTYIGCSTVPEWHYFMTFRAWMEEQDWEDKHLDKDILLPGNKVYGPDTCVFVSQSLNKFTIESNASRGDYPLGVEIDKRTGKYKATCCDFRTGKRQRLGYFDTPEEAHQAWLTFKLDLAKLLASQQTDQRIANALIKRYENYGKV